MSDDSIFSRTRRGVSWLRARLFGRHVTIYPTYAYRDPQDAAVWLAPMRVWVHDNRDTPGVEQAIERLAAAHFARDLGQPLSEEERARLADRLSCFIADDQGGAEVEFTLPGEPAPTIRLRARTTPNGVIEETIRIPDAHAPPPAAEGRWLTLDARTTDGHGAGTGRVQFLEAEGLSIVSDIDDTVKITQVPAGKETVLRNVFLHPWRAAAGMQARYEQLAAAARAAGEDVSFHYVSGSPWQLYGELGEFLLDAEHFPAGTFHLKSLRKNLLEPGAFESIRAFALGGDLATLDQKIRQITQLMIHLPRRQFVLVGDSGERDPEVYRAIQRLFPRQVRRIFIRDVLGERLAGMERITGPDVPVALDTTALEKEMLALVAGASRPAPRRFDREFT